MCCTILVTGCAGFIGYHVTKQLLERKYRIIGIDNLNSYYDVQLKKDRLEQLNGNTHFKFYLSSMEDKESFEQVFEAYPITYVIHLAAQAGVRYSLIHPDAYIQSNMIGFFNLLEACKKHSCEHLIYASSSSVYGGNKEVPFSTKDNVDHPISLYAATKKSNELMAHTYSHLYRLPTTGLRFFTVYGPWGRPDMAYYLFSKNLVEHKPIQLYNYGEMLRDFTYVDDVVESVIRIMPIKPKPYKDGYTLKDCSKSTAPYKIYNIGRGHPVEIELVLALLEEKLGKKAIKNYEPIQPGDVVKTYAEVEELNHVIQYQPKTSIEEGLDAFVQWFIKYHQIN